MYSNELPFPLVTPGPPKPNEFASLPVIFQDEAEKASKEIVGKLPINLRFFRPLSYIHPVLKDRGPNFSQALSESNEIHIVISIEDILRLKIEQPDLQKIDNDLDFSTAKVNTFKRYEGLLTQFIEKYKESFDCISYSQQLVWCKKDLERNDLIYRHLLVNQDKENSAFITEVLLPSIADNPYIAQIIQT